MPNDLYLNAARIVCAGEEEQLKKMCSDVTELHLANNEIEEWQEVE